MSEIASTPPSSKGGSNVYFLGLVGVIVIWGSSFIVVDVAVDFAPPMAIAMWRFTFASLFFLILNLIMKKRKNSPQGTTPQLLAPQLPVLSKSRYIAYLIAASLAGISLFFPAQYNAINLIGASMPALLVCLISPILITFFSFLLFKEKINRIQVLGFIIASIGAFLLITGGDVTQITSVATNFVGTLLAAATPVLWAIYSILTKELLKYKNGFQITCYTTYIGSFGLFLISIFFIDFDQWIFAISQREVLVSVLYLAAGCSVFGYLVWNHALHHLPSANVGAIFYVEPFITVLFAWIFLQQLISPYSLLGGIIVLLAIFLITWHKTGQKGI